MLSGSSAIIIRIRLWGFFNEKLFSPELRRWCHEGSKICQKMQTKILRVGLTLIIKAGREYFEITFPIRKCSFVKTEFVYGKGLSLRGFSAETL